VKPPTEWAAVYGKISAGSPDAVKKRSDRRRRDIWRCCRTQIDAQDSDFARGCLPRRDSLQSLLAAKDPKLVKTLQILLGDPALRDVALSGLAMYDDPRTPAMVLATYPSLSTSEKRTALATLSSRSPYGLELLDAVSEKQVPKTDLSADLIRQLHNLHNDKIDEMLGNIWDRYAALRPTKRPYCTYRALLAKKIEQAPDPNLGRTVFGRTCQQCHALYGVGTNIGPDLTGSTARILNICCPTLLTQAHSSQRSISRLSLRRVTAASSLNRKHGE